jgi:hypothetical protein
MPQFNEFENTVTVTIAEFAEAIRKNGLARTTGNLWQFDTEKYKAVSTNSVLDFTEQKDAKPVAACAFGQGLINIGAQYDPYSNDEQTNNERIIAQVYNTVWRMNDHQSASLNAIADSLLLAYDNTLTLTFPAFDWDRVINRDSDATNSL